MHEQQLVALVARILEIEEGVVLPLTRNDCPSWDSLRHIELVTEIEDLLGVDLSDEQVASLDSFEKITMLLEE